MTKRAVYLAGPILACTDEQATGWREQVKQALAERYTWLDPMVRDYRGDSDTDAAEIVLGDEDAIQAADLVLVNAEQPTWGTAMEVRAAAIEYRKFVIVVCNSPVVSPWLRYHAQVVLPTMSDAIDFLARLKFRE